MERADTLRFTVLLDCRPHTALGYDAKPVWRLWSHISAMAKIFQAQCESAAAHARLGEKQSRGSFPHYFRRSFFLENAKHQGNGWFLTRTMVEKNGESTPRNIPVIHVQMVAVRLGGGNVWTFLHVDVLKVAINYRLSVAWGFISILEEGGCSVVTGHISLIGGLPLCWLGLLALGCSGCSSSLSHNHRAHFQDPL